MLLDGFDFVYDSLLQKISRESDGDALSELSTYSDDELAAHYKVSII